MNRLGHMYNYKCHFCGNIFCIEHFEKHIIHYKEKEIKNVGSQITQYDTDFNKECIVCETIREIENSIKGDNK